MERNAHRSLGGVWRAGNDSAGQGDRILRRKSKGNPGNRKDRKLLAAGFRPLSIREEGTLHPARLRDEALLRVAEPDYDRKASSRRLNARRSSGSSCIHVRERCLPRIIPGSKTLETRFSATQIYAVAAEAGPLADVDAVRVRTVAKRKTVLLNRRTDHASR
jgi:hypothetical protein